MSRINAARVTVVSGVVMIVLYLVAFLVFTKSGYPDSNDGPVKIASYFTEHRGTALAQTFVFGMALLAGLVFAGGLATLLWRTEAARPLSVIAAIGAAAATGTAFVGLGFLTMLAYRAPVGDAGLLRTMMDGGYIMLNTSGYAFAVFIGAVSIASLTTMALPRWTGMVGVPVAAAQILGALTYARGDGAMSPQGWVAAVCAGVVLIWAACVCYALWRPAEATSAAPSAPAAA